MVGIDFLTAGKAIFTVEVPGGFQVEQEGVKPHYTYRINVKEGNPDSKYPNDAYFVQLLTGPENTSDYTYLGMLNPDTGEVRLTRASKYAEDSWPVRIVRRVLARIWAGESDKIEQAGWQVHHEGRCGRCGRTLTVPESIENGIGPECALKMAG